MPKMTLTRLALLAVATSFLAACNNEAVVPEAEGQVLSRAANSDFSCAAPMAGGGTQIDLTFPADCSDCSAGRLQRAIDGNANSAATLTMRMAELESTRVRVTAQDGMVFPAGGRAGATFRFTGGQSLFQPVTPVWRIVLRTYLDGVMNLNANETGSSFRTGPSEDGEGYRVYIYTPALQPFDAVEVEFQVETGGLEQSLELYEVCGDF